MKPGSLAAAQHRKKDRDNDEDNNADDYHVLAFGQPASASDDHAIRKPGQITLSRVWAVQLALRVAAALAADAAHHPPFAYPSKREQDEHRPRGSHAHLEPARLVHRQSLTVDEQVVHHLNAGVLPLR